MSLLRPIVHQTPRLSYAPNAIRHGTSRVPNKQARHYATNDSSASSTNNVPSHRRVTVFNDTGRVKWGELSSREKLARSTQQSFNFAFVALGAVMVVS